MSFIPPDLNFFVHHLSRSISHFAKQVSSSPIETATQKVALAHIKNLSSQFSEALSTKKVELLLGSEQYQWIAAFIFDLAKEETLNPKKASLTDKGQLLLEEIQDFTQLCLNKEAICETGLDQFFDQKWALDEFKIMLESQTPLALQHLEHLMTQKHPLGTQIALELSAKSPQVFKLLTKHAGLTEVEETLATLLTKPLTPSSKHAVFSTLETVGLLLEREDSEMIYHLVVDHMLHNPSSLTIDLVSTLVLGKKTRPHLYAILTERLNLCSDFAAPLFEKILQGIKNEKALIEHPFFAFLFKEIMTSENLQITLVSISAVLQPNSLLNNALWALTKGLDLSSIQKQMFKVHLKAAARHSVQLDQAERSSGRDDPFNWSTLALDYKFQVMHGLISRANRLVHFFNGDFKPAASKDLPVQDQFPKPQTLMVGAGSRTLPVISELSDYLSKESFRMTCMKRKDEEGVENLGQIPKVQLVEAELKAEIWIRDPILCHQNSFRLPAFFNLTGELEVEAKFHRQARTGLKPAFKTMAAVAVAQKQLKVMQHLLAAKRKGLFPNKEILFNFLYNEGGNCHRGVSEGKSYMIVSHDLCGMNKRALQRELYELGVRIEGGRLVKFFDSKAAPELKVKAGLEQDEQRFKTESEKVEKEFFSPITDELILQLACIDGEVDQVFPIEPCEYHLDVSSLLVDAEKKVVALNTSMGSLDLMIQIAEKKIRSSPQLEGMKEPERSVWIEKELKKVKARASYFQKKFEHQQVHENLTEENLKAHGFQVKRIPGCLLQLEKEAVEANQANFFNMISYENDAQEKCLLVLGCDQDYQEAFSQIMSHTLPNFSQLKIYFAPVELSKTLLMGGGGLHCIMQVVQ